MAGTSARAAVVAASVTPRWAGGAAVDGVRVAPVCGAPIGAAG
ncbi:hypothetical protein [Pseudonocardia sp.]